MSTTIVRVAVLCQALRPAVINSVRKPAKPGGESGQSHHVFVFSDTCQNTKIPRGHSFQFAWSFPDTEEGIVPALQMGATHI